MLFSSKSIDPDVRAIFKKSDEVAPIENSIDEETTDNVYDADDESDITDNFLEPSDDEDKCLDIVYCIKCTIQ